jgi:subtilisin family serine protease
MATPGQHDHLDGFEDFRDPPLPEGVEGSDDDEPGGAYLRRPGELLVATGDLDEAEERLAGYEVRRRDRETDELGIEVALVDDVTGALDALDRHRGRPLRVAPNHVFHPAWKFRWQTFEPPRPATARPEPAGAPQAVEHGAVAVLDTGAADHPWFAGRVEIRPGDEEAADEDGDKLLDDNRGHGTFVAGVVLAHAPGARVRAVRVPKRTAGPGGPGGLVDDLMLARALLELDGDVDVVNLSLGGATRGDAAPPAIAAALSLLRERRPDTVVVAAAGNDGWDRPTWPAAFKGVLAVGALDVNDQPASFSNRGWWVDAWAPGVDVQSTFLEWEGPLAHPLASGNHRFDGWARWCGTSFAAPRVAGAIAAADAGAGGARRAAFDLLAGGTVLRGFHGVTVDVPEHP